MKTGFDYNDVHTSFTALPLHFGGRFIFAALPAIPGLTPTPISSLQAFAAGIPAAYVQGYGQTGKGYNDPDYAVFAQDDWSISPKLILKLGLRYQRQFMYNTPYTVSIPGGAYTYKLPQDSNNWTAAGSPTIRAGMETRCTAPGNLLRQPDPGERADRRRHRRAG